MTARKTAGAGKTRKPRSSRKAASTTAKTQSAATAEAAPAARAKKAAAGIGKAAAGRSPMLARVSKRLARAGEVARKMPAVERKAPRGLEVPPKGSNAGRMPRSRAGLLTRIRELEKKVRKLRVENADLNDQLHDAVREIGSLRTWEQRAALLERILEAKERELAELKSISIQ